MGIGKQTDKAIRAHLEGAALNPDTWRYERKPRTSAPAIGPGFSNNYGPVAALLDLLSGNDAPTEPGWEDPRVWLTEWYRLNAAEGHDGFEFLSPVYGDAHLVVAMICADKGIPGAMVHVARSFAAYLMHRTWDGTLAFPGTRAVRKQNAALDQWVTYILGEKVPKQPKPQRPLRLAKAIGWRPGRELANGQLGSIVSAPGVLVHRRHERGFVSYFETGPRCYAYAQQAVVSVNGQAPVFLRPKYPTTTGKQAGKIDPALLRAEVSPNGALLIARDGTDTEQWVRLDDLNLGELVHETRIGPRAEP